ncbi:hypothetical protein ACVWXU_004478 [Streptomyces sp. TE33382]
MLALYFLATPRKCEKSFWLSSPAPSQENTTNCGGFWPGARRLAAGSFGWTPVKAVEPSPMSFTAFLGAAGPFCSASFAFFSAPAPDAREPLSPDSAPEQPARPVISAMAMAPKAILFVAAIIRPPSSLQVVCAEVPTAPPNSHAALQSPRDRPYEKTLIHLNGWFDGPFARNVRRVTLLSITIRLLRVEKSRRCTP